MDKISFPYRSSSHLILLHVIAESGAWEKHGLDVNYDYHISSRDAHELVGSGEVEFVGGNHVSAYGSRARGDGWVYVGQTMNVAKTQLVVQPDSDINGVTDLREKKVGTRGMHPGLNNWLFLKQRGLDADRDEVELVSQFDLRSMDPVASGNGQEMQPLWHWVRDRKVDAAFLSTPECIFAQEAGLKVIDVEPLPMINYTTLSSSLKFVESHPDIVERFLKGVIEGIHFFKTQPEKSIGILRDRYAKAKRLTEAQAAAAYHSIVDLLEPDLYPSMAAISNVYEEALRQDEDASKVNPLELWDLHYLRALDDAGFIGNLYGGSREK